MTAIALFLLLVAYAELVSPFCSNPFARYSLLQEQVSHQPERHDCSWGSSQKKRMVIMELSVSPMMSDTGEVEPSIASTTTTTTTTTNKKGGFGTRKKGATRGHKTVVSQWESDARFAINSNDFSYVENLLQSLDTTILPNGRNTVFVITETCRRSRNIDLVVPLLRNIPDDALSFSEDDVMPLLSECASAGNMKPVQLLVSWMQSKNVPISTKVYSVMLKGYGRQQNAAMIDKILMIDKEMDVDIIFINACMDAYVRAGYPTSAVRLFGSLLRANWKALTESLEYVDNILYNYFDMPNDNNFERIEHNFHAEMEPNTRTFNTLLKALRSSGRAGYMATLDIIDAMSSIEFTTVDSITVNTLVDTCTQNGGIEEAEHLLSDQEFGGERMTPGVEAYTSLITAYADRAMLGNAFKVLDLMAKRDIKPNKYTLTSLMNACFRAEDLNAAKSLLNKASKSSSPMKQEHLRSLHGAYLAGLSKLPNTISNIDTIYAVKEAFMEILRMNLVPDTVTMNAFIQSLCRNEPSRLKEAMEIVNAMLHEGFCPDDYTYSILFTALGEAGEVTEVKELYKKAKVKFDEPTINSMLNAYASSPDPLSAIDIFEDMTKRNYSKGEIEFFIPTKITYTILFSALSRAFAPVRMKLIKENEIDDVRLSDEVSEDPGKEASEGMIEGVIGKSVNYDRIARRLFKSMRFDYDIEADHVLINVLNKLFSLKTSSVGIFSNPSTPILSTETARLICDDLLLSGYPASDYEGILLACEYPPWKREKIRALKKRRTPKKSPASYKIFNKYGWNKVDSGFNSMGF